MGKPFEEVSTMWRAQIAKILDPDGHERAVVVSVEEYQRLLSRIDDPESSTGAALGSAREAPEPNWTPEVVASLERFAEGSYDGPGHPYTADNHDEILYGSLR